MSEKKKRRKSPHFTRSNSLVSSKDKRKYKRKGFRFRLWLFRTRLLWSNRSFGRNFNQVRFAIEKWIRGGFLLLRKRLFFSSFFKILQLVHARNRPIPQPFAQFLAESNSHQYDSREWPPSLCFLYKGYDEHKYPL